MAKYSGKLKTRLKAKLKGIEVPYEFRVLKGIPQAGDLEMDVWFAAAGKEYNYRGDGWNFEASCEGEKISPEYKIEGVGEIEGVASELVEAYLRAIAPKEAVDGWIDLGGWKIDQSGSLVED